MQQFRAAEGAARGATGCGAGGASMAGRKGRRSVETRAEASETEGKADSAMMSSQAVPRPSTNGTLRRLISEVRRDPVRSTRYGRQRKLRSHLVLVVFSWIRNRSWRRRAPRGRALARRAATAFPTPPPLRSSGGEEGRGRRRVEEGGGTKGDGRRKGRTGKRKGRMKGKRSSRRGRRRRPKTTERPPRQRRYQARP